MNFGTWGSTGSGGWGDVGWLYSVAGCCGPAHNWKVFSFRLLACSLRAPKREASSSLCPILGLAFFWLSLNLWIMSAYTTERNLSSSQWWYVITFMPYLQHILAIRGLNESALVFVKLSTRIDMGFGGNPFPISQKNSTETRVLQLFIELGFSIICEAQ